MIPPNADYLVRGYKGRELLVETWHIGEASKDLEVMVWKELIQRGEASHYEVASTRQYKVVERYP